MFYNVAFKLADIVSLISPARFLFNAGQTPNDWNAKMSNDNHIKVVKYFADSKDVFDTVVIKGGVSIILRNQNCNYGKIGKFTANNIIEKIINNPSLNGCSAFSKIVYPKSNYGLTNELYQDYPDLKERLTEGNTNILDANIFDKMPEVFIENCPGEVEDYIKVYGRYNSKRVYRFIEKKYIKPNIHLDKYKIFLPGANGTGQMGEKLSKPEVGNPFECHTQTFMSIGSFDDKVLAINCLKYIMTKFARCLLGTLKITHNTPRETWSNIPLQDFTTNSDINWEKSISDIDAQLYKKYNLGKDEVDFIESKIKPMV